MLLVDDQFKKNISVKTGLSKVCLFDDGWAVSWRKKMYNLCCFVFLIEDTLNTIKTETLTNL